MYSFNPARVRRIAFVAAFALLALASASAQTAKQRVVAVFDFAPIGSDTSLAAYGRTVADALSLELGYVGFKSVAPSKIRAAVNKRKSKAPISLEVETALAIGKSLGAEVCVLGFIALDGERVILGARAYETDSGRLAVASTQVGLAGVEIFDTIDAAAMRTAVRIRENLRPAVPTEVVIEVERVEVVTEVIESGVELGRKIEVVIKSAYADGTLFLGDSAPLPGSPAEAALALNEPGETTVTVVAKTGVPLTVTLRVPGRHDRTFTFVPDEDDAYFEVYDAYLVSSWDAGASLVSHFLEGAQGHARWFFVPEWCWVGGSLGAGFTPGSWPLTDILSQYLNLKASVDVGAYVFLPPDWPWRFGMSLGISAQAFWLVSGFYFDLMPSVKVRVEWNLPDSAVFIQLSFLSKNFCLFSNNSMDGFAPYAEAGYIWKL